MSRILGIDCGSNSFGWAVIDDCDGNLSFIDAGAGVFSAGVDKINQTGEISNNAIRSLKRSIRHQYARRKTRKSNLEKYLINSGLLPESGIKSVLHEDPYKLRAKLVNEKCALYDLGRALYHINSRRGFKSNRKSQSEEEMGGNKSVIYRGSKDGYITGIDDIHAFIHPVLSTWKSYLNVREQILGRDMSFGEYHVTVGSYLNSLNSREIPRRKRFLLRDLTRIELDVILRRQHEYYPNILTNIVIEEIIDLVIVQRPLKSCRHLVGVCTFEKNKKRAHKSHPLYQEFRLLSNINILKVYTSSRNTPGTSALTYTERENLANFMKSRKTSLELNKSLNSKVKSILGISNKESYKFNIDRLESCSTLSHLYDVFGETTVLNWDDDTIHDIWDVLNFAEDSAWLETYATKKWKEIYDLSENNISDLIRIKLEDGYGSLSIKAINKILPYMRDGLMYNEACEAAGYDHSNPDQKIVIGNKLPVLLSSEVRNPIVSKSYAVLRKLINAAYLQYGPFDVIHLELGRDLKKSKSDRLDEQRRQDINRKENIELDKKLNSMFGLDNPNKEDRIRYKLWESQNRQCIYSGEEIPAELLYNNGYTQVDHILPYSRTMDDTISNKCICIHKMNQVKGNMTPMEMSSIHIDGFDSDTFVTRVRELERVGKISHEKSKKFLMTSSEFNERYEKSNDWLPSQLNDTRYISKLLSKKIQHVCKNVVITNGSVTSILRKRWGLDTILPDLAREKRAWLDTAATSNGMKSRYDHRHHAIDAIVIALTTPAVIRSISTMNATYNSRGNRILLPEAPIAGLKHIVQYHVNRMAVYHEINKRKRGALHAESIFGLALDQNGSQMISDSGKPMYSIRKSLNRLSCKDINNIVDPVVKSIIMNRVESFGGDLNKELPKNVFKEPLYMPLKTGGLGNQIKKVKVFEISTTMIKLKKRGVYVEPDGNYNIILGNIVNGKRKYKVNTLFESVSGNLAEFENPDITFRKNEMYIHNDIEDVNDMDPWDIYRVQKFDNKVITFRHNSSAKQEDNSSRLIKSPNTVTGRKVEVNILGKIKLC